MPTSLLITLTLILLQGCAGWPAWPLAAPSVQTAAASGAYDFNWRLSGHRDVAPLQVFDDGRRMWLQFAPGQPIPAIFSVTQQGQQPVPYVRDGPYVILPQVWPALVLRGGQRLSQVKRAAPPIAAAEPVGSAVVPKEVEVVVASQAPASPPAKADAIPIATPMSASDITAASFTAAISDASPYEVSPRDLTLRAALARWAGLAGWTFQPEHWDVDVDIPIAGSARFDGDFKHAVQELVASTELADRPVQPCFYANRVLRVVPYAQPCDRSVGGARPS